MENLETQETPQEEQVNNSQEEVQEEQEQDSQEDLPDIDPESFEIETRGASQEEALELDDVDPDDLKTIEAIVEKKTQSFKKALQEEQDRREVEMFVQTRPEFNKYKNVIMKYLKHPVYGQIPVKNIAAMVAADDLMKIGAKKEREAQAKADLTRSTGQATRQPEMGTPDWSKMSKADFEAYKRKVIQTQ